MPTAPANRIDSQFHDFEVDGASLFKHVKATTKSLRLAKACAYRMAKNYLAMQSADHNRLLDLIRSTEGEGANAIDRWIEKWFAPLGAIGEDPWALVKAVEKGMTHKAYLATAPAVFLGQKNREARVSAMPRAQPLPSVPTPEAPPEVQLSQWRARAEAAELNAIGMRRELDEARRTIARLELTIKRMQRVVGAAN